MTAPFSFRFTVDHVHDGDTIMGELDQGLGVYQRPISVRLAGVDAPELDTDEGKIAAAGLQALVKQGDVLSVVSLGWDKYSGRIDAKIFGPNGEDIISSGLKDGWLRAWDGRGPKPWP